VQIPLQVSFRGLAHDDRVEAHCAEHVAKLEQLHDRITACRVTITQPNHHHSKGERVEVTVDTTLPGHEIVVHRDHTAARKPDDLLLAVNEAFEISRRRIDDYVSKRRERDQSGKRSA